jgi:hypothetical protein
VTRTLALALLAGLLTAASCDGGKPPTTPATSNAAEAGLELSTLVQQSIPGQGGATVREVVRDQAAWAALWAKLREGSALPEEPPAVDFAREMVAVAAMETQPCVSRVTIRSAVETGGALVIDVLEAPPAPNCVCITAERPIHAVRLRRVDAPARFTVERGQTPC